MNGENECLGSGSIAVISCWVDTLFRALCKLKIIPANQMICIVTETTITKHLTGWDDC